jgi:hypothetical protein
MQRSVLAMHLTHSEFPSLTMHFSFALRQLAQAFCFFSLIKTAGALPGDVGSVCAPETLLCDGPLFGGGCNDGAGAGVFGVCECPLNDVRLYLCGEVCRSVLLASG